MCWDSKSHKHRAHILPAVIYIVCDVVVIPLVAPTTANVEAVVRCFTAHECWDGSQHIIWHAHPCHRSKESHPNDVWYDWA